MYLCKPSTPTELLYTHDCVLQQHSNSDNIHLHQAMRVSVSPIAITQHSY